MLKASVDRVSWTSDSHTGMFQAFRHKQRRPREGDECIQKNYFGHTVGFATRADAVRFMED